MVFLRCSIKFTFRFNDFPAVGLTVTTDTLAPFSSTHSLHEKSSEELRTEGQQSQGTKGETQLYHKHLKIKLEDDCLLGCCAV
jgi:hypothetical protein